MEQNLIKQIVLRVNIDIPQHTYTSPLIFMVWYRHFKRSDMVKCVLRARALPFLVKRCENIFFRYNNNNNPPHTNTKKAKRSKMRHMHACKWWIVPNLTFYYIYARVPLQVFSGIHTSSHGNRWSYVHIWSCDYIVCNSRLITLWLSPLRVKWSVSECGPSWVPDSGGSCIHRGLQTMGTLVALIISMSIRKFHQYIYKLHVLYLTKMWIDGTPILLTLVYLTERAASVV